MYKSKRENNKLFQWLLKSWKWWVIPLIVMSLITVFIFIFGYYDKTGTTYSNELHGNAWSKVK